MYPPKDAHHSVKVAVHDGAHKMGLTLGRAEAPAVPHLPLLLQPSQARGITSSRIHGFIQQTSSLCEAQCSVCPLGRAPAMLLNNHCQQNMETPTSPRLR